MKRLLPELVAQITDVLIAVGTVVLVIAASRSTDPLPGETVAVALGWVFLWCVTCAIAPFRAALAWLLRLLLSSAYFGFVAWAWRSANGESRTYLLLFGSPFAALTLSYAVLLLWSRTRSRAALRQRMPA